MNGSKGSMAPCLVAAWSPGWFVGDPTSPARDNMVEIVPHYINSSRIENKLLQSDIDNTRTLTFAGIIQNRRTVYSVRYYGWRQRQKETSKKKTWIHWSTSGMNVCPILYHQLRQAISICLMLATNCLLQ